MKKNLLPYLWFAAIGILLAHLFFLLMSKIPSLESLVPAERCVKSAYNVDNDRKRISINCVDYRDKVHTVVVRKFEVEEDIEKMKAAFKNGADLEGFSCTRLNGLDACFSAKYKIMVSSINEESVVFYVLQFNKNFRPN